MDKNQTKPDQSVLPSFARSVNGVTRQIEDLRQSHLYTGGALAVKTKILMALLWSVSVRCEPCIAYYSRRAKEFGTSAPELGEALAVAVAMGACVAETWAVKAFAHATSDDGSPACRC